MSITDKFRASTVVLSVTWLVMFITQNNFYGWNSKPSTEGELLTDHIRLILLAAALVCSLFARRSQ
jgi:hypothetical protein